MNNAEKFQEIFGYYATEMWAKPEKEFLDWANAEYNTTIKTNERVGEWIFDDPLRADFRCSECFERNDVCTNFCPYCGADMRGEK